MLKLSILSVLVILVTIACQPACGAELSNLGISGDVSTLGLNLSLSYKLNDYVSVSGGFNHFSRSGSGNLKDVDYSYDLQLSSETLLVNLYPFAGGFHLTGGLVHNGNSLSLTGQPSSNGTYTFNGNTYTAQQVGTVAAGLTFKSMAPYLGIGWGGNGSWGMTFDLGVVEQGAPTFNLSASAATSNPQLASDVAQQKSITQQDVNSFTWYPQIALGFYFHF